jgi:hypothetical protein
MLASSQNLFGRSDLYNRPFVKKKNMLSGKEMKTCFDGIVPGTIV